jgi:hypothetical protein
VLLAREGSRAAPPRVPVLASLDGLPGLVADGDP